ncbi:MAG: hypothetical protein NVSMB39_5320 [Candidatus Saccharimonadales bacterium]
MRWPELTSIQVADEVEMLLRHVPDVQMPPSYEQCKVEHALVGEYVAVTLAFPISPSFNPGLHLRIKNAPNKWLASVDECPYCWQQLAEGEGEADGGTVIEAWKALGLKIRVAGPKHSATLEVTEQYGYPGFVAKNFTHDEWTNLTFELVR